MNRHIRKEIKSLIDRQLVNWLARRTNVQTGGHTGGHTDGQMDGQTDYVNHQDRNYHRNH